MGYEERGLAPHNICRLDSRSFRPDLIHQEVHPILASRETTGHLRHTGIRYIQVHTGSDKYRYQMATRSFIWPQAQYIYLHSSIGKPDNTKMDENKVQPRFHIYSNNQQSQIRKLPNGLLVKRRRFCRLNKRENSSNLEILGLP